MQLEIRAYVDADWPLVMDSAQRSIRKHPIAKNLCAGEVVFLLAPMLKKWNALVAVDPETGVGLGWLVYRDPGLVAWGFVKPWYRRKGVMRGLAEHAAIASGFDLVFPTNLKFRAWRPRFRPFALIAPLVTLP